MIAMFQKARKALIRFPSKQSEGLEELLAAESQPMMEEAQPQHSDRMAY